MNHVKKARSIYSNIIRCMIVILYLHSYHANQIDLLCQVMSFYLSISCSRETCFCGVSCLTFWKKNLPPTQLDIEYGKHWNDGIHVCHCRGGRAQVGYSWLFFGQRIIASLKSAKTKNPRDLFCFLLKDEPETGSLPGKRGGVPEN